MKQDLHMHTTYCDGKSTPREMVLSAIDKGFDVIGFSAHSYASCDIGVCILSEKVSDYIAEIHALQQEFAGKIKILCGIEQDYYAEYPTDEFEYVIGSVHYVKVGDDYVSVDNNKELFKSDCEKYFGGDYYAFAELYFETVSNMFDKWDIDIIGHFDLITKFNEGYRFFDEKNPRYVSAWKKACDKLLKYNKPFEINVGAISRGHKTTPYPSSDILEYIKANGGKLILNSDAHHCDNIGYRFKEFEGLL